MENLDKLIQKIKKETKSNDCEFTILLRFSSSGKAFSMKVPSTWNVAKLEDFIKFTFKEEVQNSTKINLLFGAKKLENSTLMINKILKSGDKEINQIFVTTLKTSGELEKEPDKKNLYIDSSFEKTENVFFNYYKELVHKKEDASIQEKKQAFLFKLPLMHPGLNQRLTSFNEKKKLDMISMADFGHIENFSFRDYFKIELLFKLLFFFILFGVHMKGINLPIFVILLIIYYWYYLIMDINAFYDKKIGEIKLTKEEIQEIKMELAQDKEGNNHDEEEDYDDKNRENKEIQENLINSINDNELTGHNQEENNLDNENDVDYDLNYVQENELNFENEKEKNNLVSKNKSDKKLPEMEGISDLMKKYENSPQKKRNSVKKNRENAFMYYASFIFEITFTFTMSLFPFWYDEYEAHNPIIAQNNQQINIEDSAVQNNINANNQIIDDVDRGNVNDVNADDFNRLDNVRDKIRRKISIEENDSLIPEVDTVNKNQRLPDYSKSQASEKILIKSSNDTRLVNNSEDLNNNPRTKYILVEENENRTEKEFVFSENVNIDNLSYNEPIIESLKKRSEKENDETHLK